MNQIGRKEHKNARSHQRRNDAAGGRAAPVLRPAHIIVAMSRPRGAVGRNVLRKEGADKVTGRAQYIDDLTFPDLLYARTVRSTIPAGEIAAIRFNFDTDGFTIVDHRDIPGRNIVALIDDDQPCLAARVGPPCRGADPAAGPRRSRAPVVRGRPDRLPGDHARSSTRRCPARRSRPFASTRAASTRGWRRPISSSRANIAPATRSSCTSSRTASSRCPMRSRGGITVYGSMQCPYYVHRSLTVLLDLADDQVRVIQTETGGGFGGKEEYPSVIAGHAALVALQGAPAGENRLRPRRGHAGDHETPPRDRPASHRREAGWHADGDRHRRRDRWRRLRHAERGRAVARADSRERPVPLRSRADPREGGDDQHAAQRRISGIWRAANAVCGRSAHGSDRGTARPGPGADPRGQRVETGRHDRDRPAPGKGLQRPGRPAAGGRAHRLQTAPPRAGADAADPAASRHRPRAVLPRIGIHRQRRGQARLESLARADRSRRAHSRRQHGDRAGHPDDARADRRGYARMAV